MPEHKQNLLAGETSPYLLQHADNPVQWYPWGETALTKAQAEDKPILLSIGYSACHWCHVMAHESFENPAIAELMNKHFINIKIDREERPDLDKIYQTAQQILTGRTGGWPLTLFLMPDDQVPFFGGTYFPPTPRHGLPGFPDLLLRINDAYHHRRDDIREQNTSFVQAMQRTVTSGTGKQTAPPDLTPIVTCIERLHAIYDKQHGGFGNAPKFPHPDNLELLLRAQSLPLPQTLQQNALTMLATTLNNMADGGIYDQLGGGFCRYAVDAAWQIPHFEKMLYDNGPLSGLYARAGTLTDNPRFTTIAQQTADWVCREMQAAEGGYYSSLDADSEGGEGQFYIWDQQQVTALLSEQQYRLFSLRYGLDAPPNFEGHWHLHADQTPAAIAQQLNLQQTEVEQTLLKAGTILLQAREQRPRPARDEKILTSWNALMIKGMANAAQHCRQPRYLDSAAAALDFIHTRLWQDQRLLATCKDGKAHLNAYLDDYAFLIDAILTLLSCRWETRWLHFAIALAEVLLQQFYDTENGGFFFTSHDHERLLQRRKDFTDDALPAGNGIAVSALLRLAHLTGDPACRQAAEHTLTAAADIMQRAPHACTAMLSGLTEFHQPTSHIILRGEPEAMQAWQQQLRHHCCFAIPADEQTLPTLLAEKTPVEGQVTAYVCKGFSCSARLHDLDSVVAIGI